MSVNGKLVEDKIRRIKCAFYFNNCPIYTQDGASAKFSTNSHETDNIVCAIIPDSKMVSPLLNFESLYHYLDLCLHQLIEGEVCVTGCNCARAEL